MLLMLLILMHVERYIRMYCIYAHSLGNASLQVAAVTGLFRQTVMYVPDEACGGQKDAGNGYEVTLLLLH